MYDACTAELFTHTVLGWRGGKAYPIALAALDDDDLVYRSSTHPEPDQLTHEQWVAYFAAHYDALAVVPGADRFGRKIGRGGTVTVATATKRWPGTIVLHPHQEDPT